jgi:feruloyl esterase
MPAEGWNRKFMGVGNGGWSGTISFPALATALGRGYAVASTNTGHDGGDASFVPVIRRSWWTSPIGPYTK